MIKICYGCGSKLQFDDKDKEGYIPKDKIENSTYCQRCFRLIHYGENKDSITPKSVNSIINTINKNAKYVLFLIDFITLDSNILNVFKKIKVPKCLVISKCDIIPNSIRFEAIVQSLRVIYGITSDIRFISSYDNLGINSLLKFLEEKTNECYIIGESNSGKSTLINKMIDYAGSKLNKITTSYNLNTTLDFIRLNLSNKLTIIDSPGFVISDRLELGFLNKNTIKEGINPKVYQMKDGETLSVNDFFLKFENKCNVTLYMSNCISVKKYYKDINFSYDLNLDDNTDLIIKGLGFINIKNKTKIRVFNINNNYLEVRKSIFGGSYE